MPRKNDKTLTVHVNIDKNDIALFDKLYPSCRRRFIENAIKLTLNDKEFFDRIFFYNLFNKGV